jgi:spore coat protein JB
MMRRLQVLDFALQELTLYLDMYPDCRRAMEKYHTLREEREGVKAALEAAGYPITCVGNMSREHWDWGEGPWPWEYDFAGNCGELER